MSLEYSGLFFGAGGINKGIEHPSHYLLFTAMVVGYGAHDPTVVYTVDMKSLRDFFKKKSTAETVLNKVTKEGIKSAYEKRSSEIESLRKYDRGEKTITPRDLRSFVRSV